MFRVLFQTTSISWSKALYPIYFPIKLRSSETQNHMFIKVIEHRGFYKKLGGSAHVRCIKISRGEH